MIQSGFTRAWLDVREVADARSRSSELADAIAATLGNRHRLRIVDLATGTGSNARYLINRIPRAQDWLLIDRDQSLLSTIPTRMRDWASGRGYQIVSNRDEILVTRDGLTDRLRVRRMDLKMGVRLETSADLVTASALLDLVSEQWVRSLVAYCETERAAVLVALTYDGRMELDPREPEDDDIRRYVNLHQRKDKGFGPALGAQAADFTERRLGDAGYVCRRAPSDWLLTAESAAMQRHLITGWAQASLETARENRRSIEGWRKRRLEHIAASRSRIMVGHIDLAAWPNA